MALFLSLTHTPAKQFPDSQVIKADVSQEHLIKA